MSARRAPRRLAVVVGLGLVAMMAACGVPQDSGPRPIAVNDIPFGLLDQPSTTTTAVPSASQRRAVTVYLIDGKGLLRAVSRDVTIPVTIAKVVNVLLQPPTPAEVADGLTSAINRNTVLRGIDGPVDGLLTVDLSSSLLQVTGRRQIQAFAQVVFTVAEIADVERVLFEFDGRRRDVPRGDGDLSSSPLTPRDYRALEPPTTTSTTDP